MSTASQFYRLTLPIHTLYLGQFSCFRWELRHLLQVPFATIADLPESPRITLACTNCRTNCHSSSRQFQCIASVCSSFIECGLQYTHGQKNLSFLDCLIKIEHRCRNNSLFANAMDDMTICLLPQQTLHFKISF